MGAKYNHYSDEVILELLRSNQSIGLKSLFDQYYQDLFRYSYKIVRQREAAEEIAQDIFIQIWERRETLNITKSIKSYLFTASKNRSINYLKSSYVKMKFEEIKYLQVTPIRDDQENQLGDDLKLDEILQEAIQLLPEKCRIIFNLAKFAGMSYQEIADQLSISKKTVQAQLGIAMHKIKLHADYHLKKLDNKNFTILLGFFNNQLDVL